MYSTVLHCTVLPTWKSTVKWSAQGCPSPTNPTTSTWPPAPKTGLLLPKSPTYLYGKTDGKLTSGMRGPPTADMQGVSRNNREKESTLVCSLLCSNHSVLGFCAKTLQLWTLSLLTRSSLTNDQWVLANDQ